VLLKEVGLVKPFRPQAPINIVRYSRHEDLQAVVRIRTDAACTTPQAGNSPRSVQE